MDKTKQLSQQYGSNLVSDAFCWRVLIRLVCELRQHMKKEKTLKMEKKVFVKSLPSSIVIVKF